jgi:hypothetical protein
MIRHPLYALWGMLVLGGVWMAQYRGWSLDRVNELKNVPRSVRDNPGAYRSHYSYVPRYSGGK